MAGPHRASNSTSNDSISLEKAQKELSKSRLSYYKELLIYNEVLELLTKFNTAKKLVTSEISEEDVLKQEGLSSSTESYEKLQKDLALALASERLKIRLPADGFGLKGEKKTEKEKTEKDKTKADKMDKDKTEKDKMGVNDGIKGEKGNGVYEEKIEWENLSGSKTHFLGVKPDEIQIERKIQEDIVGEMNERLHEKHQKIVKILEPIGESERGERNRPDLSLSERVLAASRRQEEKELSLRKEEATVVQLYEKYEQEQAQILLLTVEIVEQYKLQQRPKYEHLRMEILLKKASNFEQELRKIQKGIREETYTSETVPALQVIRGHLDAQIQELSASLAKGKSRLLEYERLGYEFADLARRYREALSHLEMQKSIYEDLVNNMETMGDSYGQKDDSWNDGSSSLDY